MSAFVFCFDSDGHTVFIGTTNKNYIFIFSAKVTHIYIGWNVHSRYVSEVQGSVCIRQSRSNGITLLSHGAKIKERRRLALIPRFFSPQLNGGKQQ